MEDFKDEFIDANGIRIHYVTAGQGPLLLLLHGFPQFWYTWRKIIPKFSKEYKVVVPDLRGYGQTDKPKNIEDYKLSALGNDAAALIRALGYDKADIVGHDWGGAAGWMVALQHPEMVKHLVTINAPHPAIFAKALTSNYKQTLKSWYMFVAQIPKLPEYLLGRDVKGFMKGIFKKQAKNKDAFSKEDIDRYAAEYEKDGVLKASMDYYRAAFKYRNERPPKIPIASPTLLIWGEDDIALGKDLTYDMDKYFAAPFKVEYLPNCSHWVVDEQPETVANLVREFLRTQ